MADSRASGADVSLRAIGLGDVGANFGDINAPSKWVLCIAMLLGRLEIFTLLVVLTPAFWRR